VVTDSAVAAVGRVRSGDSNSRLLRLDSPITPPIASASSTPEMPERSNRKVFHSPEPESEDIDELESEDGTIEIDTEGGEASTDNRYVKSVFVDDSAREVR
jgi:hypothetical protein